MCPHCIFLIFAIIFCLCILCILLLTMAVAVVGSEASSLDESGNRNVNLQPLFGKGLLHFVLSCALNCWVRNNNIIINNTVGTLLVVHLYLDWDMHNGA